MPRRKKNSPADGLLELIALLPWWAGVALAIASYLWLHHVATLPVAAVPVQPGQLNAMVKQGLWHGLANVGQYLLPMICLMGAAASAWRRRERKTLVDSVARNPAADALDGMSWRQFERLVGEAFRLQGYQVLETGGGGADGGVDLVLTRGGEKFLVQCKQWKAFNVSVEAVRELYGVMAAKGAAGGFVVTSGRFTGDAKSFADGRNVKLIDGPKLHAMIQQVQGIRTSGAGQARAEPPAETTVKRKEPTFTESPTPMCPSCGKPMVKRTARKGANAGAEFWGCTGYPACKGTRRFHSA